MGAMPKWRALIFELLISLRGGERRPARRGASADAFIRFPASNIFLRLFFVSKQLLPKGVRDEILN